MARFIIGLILGVTLASANAEPLTDYLHGWVVVKNGRVVCSSPFVWGYKQTIDCDLGR